MFGIGKAPYLPFQVPLRAVPKEVYKKYRDVFWGSV